MYHNQKTFIINDKITISGSWINHNKNSNNVFIILHGWGADGKDLEGLVPILMQVSPNSIFFVPNAPYVCTANPNGFQWFELHSNDFHSFENTEACKNSSIYIDELINLISIETNISSNKIMLSGFSQGGMVSLSAGLKYKKKLAGVISISGAFINNFKELDDLNSSPCLLIHGKEDQVVPIKEMEIAFKKINKFGNTCEQYSIPNLGHGINEDCIRIIGNFIRQYLL